MNHKKLILNLQAAKNQRKPWKKEAFEAFYAMMTNDSQRFPCVFGSSGVKTRQVRYAFLDSSSFTPDVETLGGILESYLSISKTLGKNTSLVVFFKPDQRRFTLTEYELHFWQILQELNNIDQFEWPGSIPKNPDHYLWEFSFAGDSMFVVCSNPAHKARKSRYFDTFMLTFQPRWVFDALKGSRFKKGKETVRKILKAYDEIPAYPELGIYGDKNNREWRQYFLPDSNNDLISCPFYVKKDFEFYPGTPQTLSQAVQELLPESGYVEVQRDPPKKQHTLHTHPTDETLLIVEGDIVFSIGSEQIRCTSGDRILLTANTPHSSITHNGCTYVISTKLKPAA